MDDREFVLRAQQGDRSAFDVLVDLHHEPITHFIFRYFSDVDDIQDAVQEVFIRAFSNLKQFDPSVGEFRSWLFKIASNTSISEIRRRKTRRNYDQQEILAEEESRRRIDTPDEDHMTGSLVQTVIQQLPPKERLVLILHYYHNMTQQEMAEELGIPLGTIKSRMRNGMARARQGLRKLSKGDGE
ncbi:RNA polymerase sigma factor [Gemmatimonadota bacterium]